MLLLYYFVVTLHMILLLFTLFGWLFNDKRICILLLCLQVVTIFLFVYFNGCILTMVEKKICKDKTRPTLIDPLLSLMGYKVNGVNRRRVSLFLFVIAFIMTLNKIDKLFNKTD